MTWAFILPLSPNLKPAEQNYHLREYYRWLLFSTSARIFLETGTGSPFRPDKPGKVIKLLLPGRPERGVDLYLLDLILTNTEKADIVILLPAVEKAKRKFGVANSYYAVVVRDGDGTVYLLRGNDKERLTGSTSELQAELKSIQQKDKRIFHLRTVRVTDEMFDKIRTWSIRRVDELSAVLPDMQERKNREILLHLIDSLFLHEGERDKARRATMLMGQKEVDRIIEHLEKFLRHLFQAIIGSPGNPGTNS